MNASSGASPWNSPSRHNIEPELLAVTPRRARKRRGKGRGRGCLKLFILPHSIIGVGALLLALHATFVLLFGPLVPGQIVRGHAKTDSDGDTRHYYDYTFIHHDARHNATSQVDANVATAYAPATAVQVRVSPFAPSRGSQLVLPGAAAPAVFGNIWLFALFWNGALGIAWWLLFVAPWQARQLVENGVPVEGRVTNKTSASGESSMTYLVHYDFAPSGLAERVTGKMSVAEDEWNALARGAAVTVLHDPLKPRRHTLYAYGDYEAAA